MGDNKKPILSVLVDEEKKRLFADLARANKQSMGWLLNQAIDKMLEYNSIYIYRDSVNPIDGEAPKPLPSSDIEEVVRRYVDKANESITDDLLNLQAQVTELTANRDNGDDMRADVADLREQLAQLTTKASVTTHTDVDPAEIQAYIDRCYGELRAEIEALKGTTTPQSAAIKTTSTPGEVHNEVLKVARRLEKETALKSAVIDGLAAGHTGENLGQYLADKGFLNSNGGKYTGASNSRFRLAIEHLNNA